MVDAAEPTMPIDLPALQDHQQYQSQRFPSVAHAIEQVRTTVLRGSAFPPIDEVVAAVPVEILLATAPRPPHAPAWIPDELYPYRAAR